MKSLGKDLEENRDSAVKLMLDNNITHISIAENALYGVETDVPCVVLVNKQEEIYDTEVTDIKLINGEICFKANNTALLPSDTFVNEEGYINYHQCAYHSANNLYQAVEFFCDNLLYVTDVFRKLGKEIEQKFIEVLSDYEDKSFTFKVCDKFYMYHGTREVSFKRVYVREGRVMLETSSNSETFLLNGIYLEERYQLFKHLIESITSIC